MSAQHPDPTTVPPVREIPPPPADFFSKVLAQAEAEEAAEAAEAAEARVSTTPTNEGAEADRPSPMCLAEVRGIAFKWLLAQDASPGEADDVASEVVAYVDVGWRSLGLHALASNRDLWHRHVRREALRRWLAHLLRRTEAAVQESDARRCFQALVEHAALDPQDRMLLERLWVYGFTLEETATALGWGRIEVSAHLQRVTSRLRGALAMATTPTPRAGSLDISGRSDYTTAASCNRARPSSNVRQADPGLHGHRQTTTLTPTHARAVWGLVVDALVDRGASHVDAEDVAQEVLLVIMRNPEAYLDKLAELEQNKGWFIWLAANRYLMMLRAERRRRRRESLTRWIVAEPGEETFRRAPHVDAILSLATEARLTARQQAYVRAVFVEDLSIEDIAEITNTTPRAVRAVLRRAVERLQQHLLDAPPTEVGEVGTARDRRPGGREAVGLSDVARQAI